MVKVSEYMTRNVITINEEATVKDVIELIKKTGHNSFPVVRDGKLVGIISVRDIVGEDENKKVKELMTKREDMVVTYPDANIMDVGRIMFRTGFSKLPVVDSENNLVGIISNMDVIRSQIEKTTPKKLEKIVKTYESLGYNPKVERGKVKVSKIKPTQNKIEADELLGRIYEIKKGLAEPIIVLKTKKDYYILVDGHHRAVAAKRLGIDELDAYIIYLDTDKKLGIEKTAEAMNLKSLDDIKIVETNKDMDVVISHDCKRS
ncbi:CBS domain-containing ParB/RepB/Spo0J family partition protein [Methanocaldococcus infernus]|uniref:CBS domain containing protein n=1 Tax=Methanocaldococcus infernus (strain DSM 11812 / JCM 15783 / ME) TaxID=573063 RepID=D5VRD0_METIM|nr:CBS domain-containing protein [Methanocaldococcus infernus]ADG13133.1 CBS domain containing protein [Methanocaldococcus infernus ME]